MAQYVAGSDSETGIDAQEWILHTGSRKESQLDAYQPCQNQAQPERGCGIPQQGDRGEPTVFPSVTAHCLPHSEPEPDGKVEEENATAQQQCCRQTFSQQGCYRSGVLDGNSEVAFYQTADERDVLGAEGLVQTVARSQGG